MTNEEQLVSNYEYNRRDKLRSVIADYLSDAGVTAQFIVDEIKEELNGQLEYYRCKTDKISEAVELFAINIMKAGDDFYVNPMDTPFIPTWSRVKSAIPDFLTKLNKAVSEDNKDNS